MLVRAGAGAGAPPQHRPLAGEAADKGGWGRGSLLRGAEAGAEIPGGISDGG